ncbi:CapA family protein [Candidatus Berkelbacteria bacterium]|nr:CapA family protein [Candidatus Berkelbacteria bacterium]
MPERALEKQPITLTFVGDVMLARNVGRQMISHGIDYPFEKVTAELKNSDITFGNLEGCLLGDKVTGSSKAFVFRSPPRFGQALKNAGFHVMSLANNHALDGGRQGVISTIDTLDQLAITPVGAGANRQGARQLKVLTAAGWRVGFLAYTDIQNIKGSAATDQLPGVATVTPIAEMVSDIKQARGQVDILVVSCHWGVEYQIGKPNARQVMIAGKAKAAGAQIVIGHHPHVLQHLEIDKEKKIVAYSLGNFVFDNHKPSRAATAILRVTIEPEGKQTINVLACKIIACQPHRVSLKGAKR